MCKAFPVYKTFPITKYAFHYEQHLLNNVFTVPGKRHAFVTTEVTSQCPETPGIAEKAPLYARLMSHLWKKNSGFACQ